MRVNLQKFLSSSAMAGTSTGNDLTLACGLGADISSAEIKPSFQSNILFPSAVCIMSQSSLVMCTVMLFIRFKFVLDDVTNLEVTEHPRFRGVGLNRSRYRSGYSKSHPMASSPAETRPSAGLTATGHRARGWAGPPSSSCRHRSEDLSRNCNCFPR